MRLAEVAPAAPIVIEAVPWLLALAGLLLALGLIKFVHYFIDFVMYVLRKTVGRIPGVGGAISGLAKSGAAKLTNALGAAEQGLDRYIGYCFHNLSTLVRLLKREITGLGKDLWTVAKFLAAHPSWAELRHFANALVHPIRTFQHLERRLLNVYRHAIARIEHTVAQGVYPRIRAGEAALEHVIEWDIPRLRARERALAREYENLRKWVKAHARPIATLAFVGAVALALRRLGLGWLRCKNVKSVGKRLCGLPTDLVEALLAVALSYELLVDPKEIARLALDVETAFEGVFEQIAG